MACFELVFFEIGFSCPQLFQFSCLQSLNMHTPMSGQREGFLSPTQSTSADRRTRVPFRFLPTIHIRIENSCDYQRPVI